MKDILKPEAKVTPAADAKPSIIINNIDVRPVNRTNQDIPNWRSGIKAFEARTPRYGILHDLKCDVMLDGHVIAVIGKRLDAVTTANWQFVNKDGKPVDAINEVIDSVGFDDVTGESFLSKMWGYTMLEPTFWKNSSGKWEVSANLLPRPNYRPLLGVVAYDWSTDEGINIREGIYAKTVMEVGNPRDMGLLTSAAQYAILKRGGIGDYAMFVQVFGRPILDATWDGFDETQRLKLQEALNIGAGGTIIRPQGTEINIIESKLTQSSIHGDFKKDMNAEISKALLGTTETTESSDSSGYAQSKEHGDQDDAKHDSDINFVRKVLNSRFIKVLEAAGFNTEGGSFIIQGEETKLSTKESFEMHFKMAKELGLPIDDDFFYETYGVPKPDNYDQLKAEKEALKNTGEGGLPTDDLSTKSNADKKKKDKTPKDSKEVKLSFWKQLKSLFLTAPAETTGATHGHHHTVNLTLDETLDSTEFLKRVYYAGGTLHFDFGLFDYTVKTLLKGFKKGWDNDFIGLEYAPSFEYGADDPALLTAFEQNIFKFAGAKTLAEMQMLNDLFKRSKSFEEFYEAARQQVEIYNKDWLLTEYNTAVLTGEAAATYNRLKAQTDIFPYWEYKTAGDNHVRHSHQLLDGIILPASDPRWKKLFPPNGWNCRCYIVPRMRHEYDESKLKAHQARADAYLNSPEFEKEQAQGWGVNRGDINEVFTANQMYIHKFPGMASKLLNGLGATDFNLKQYSNAKKAATAEAPNFEGTVTAWFEALEVLDDKPVLRDYNNRPLLVDTKNFNRHIAKKDDRGILLAAMEQALMQPDEVWLNGSELEDLVYVKYFKDKTLVTIADIRNSKLELSTWFTLSEVQKIIKKYRRGLLVFSK